MTYLKLVAFVFAVLMVIAIETIPGAIAQGGYHRPGSQSDQPWLRSMDASQSPSYSKYPQRSAPRQARNQGIIAAKRQRQMQQAIAGTSQALQMADQALNAGNRTAAWNILNSVRNSLEGLSQNDSDNPLWAIGLAEFWGCERYPKPDRVQMYLQQAQMAAARGASPEVNRRLQRARGMLAAGRSYHKNAWHPTIGVPKSAFTNRAAQEAESQGDYMAASRLQSGIGNADDHHKYGY